MKEYIIVELANHSKYVIIDVLIHENKKYVLLSKVSDNGKDINKYFDICLYNDILNNFEMVEDEFEYDNVKLVFEKRLEENKRELEYLNKYTSDMVKVKVIKIDGYHYTLEKDNHNQVIKNIELYGNVKINLNDYIYISENTLNEKNLLQYGPLINNESEIIKVVTEQSEYYLQRYYG